MKTIDKIVIDVMKDVFEHLGDHIQVSLVLVYSSSFLRVPFPN